MTSSGTWFLSHPTAVHRPDDAELVGTRAYFEGSVLSVQIARVARIQRASARTARMQHAFLLSSAFAGEMGATQEQRSPSQQVWSDQSRGTTPGSASSSRSLVKRRQTIDGTDLDGTTRHITYLIPAPRRAALQRTAPTHTTLYTKHMRHTTLYCTVPRHTFERLPLWTNQHFWGLVSRPLHHSLLINSITS